MNAMLRRLLYSTRARNDGDGDSHVAVRGRLFVVSAPSGAGKTSLVKALLERCPEMRVSISHTTRSQRSSEVDGKDYFFVDKVQFERMKAAGDFLESAQVFDNYYGTSHSAVTAMLDSGRDVMLEIDWQGARQVRLAEPGAISVFILPPSREELERRLRGRGTDSDTVIRRRLDDAVADMGHCDEFDYVVVNDSFEAAVDELVAIVGDTGEASRAGRPALVPILKNLLE
ncbi:MAG: guanylate kinase [Pseudomonadota bacterium]